MKLPAPIASVVEALLAACVPARGAHVDGERDGVWTKTFRARAVSATTWKRGRKHGRDTRWFLDGTKRWVGEWQDGDQTGEWFYFRRDGKLDSRRTGRYERGLRFSALRGFNDWNP